MRPRGRPKCELKAKSLKLYAHILKHDLRNATDKQLAEALGFSERSVSRYLSWLRENKYVELVYERRFLTNWINRRTITCTKKFIVEIGAPDGVHEEQEPSEEDPHA